MSLNRAQLAEDLKNLFKEMKSYEDADTAMEVYTQKLSAILDLYIKSGTVIVQAGILVTTFNSTGTTTSTGTGIIT